MRVLISGVTGCRNRGVEALVRTILEGVVQQFPEANISVLSGDPEYDQNRISNVIPDPFQLGPMRRLRELNAALGRLAYVTPGAGRLRGMLRRANVLVVTGGDLFGSDYGDYEVHLAPARVALRCGVPVVFMAHSVGPFRPEASGRPWVEIAKRAALVTVRESLTFEYLRQMGLPADRLALTADPAFLLEPLKGDVAERLWASMGISGKRPLVAFAMSQGITSFANVDRARHRETWLKLAAGLLAKGFELVLVPHVQERSELNDDRLIASWLMRQLGYPAGVYLAGGDFDARELKTLIARCDLVIAERMHAAIAGISSGVPTIVVGYSVKAEGILRDVLGIDPASAGLLLSVRQFVEESALTDRVLDVWEDREKLKETLQVSCAESRRRAMDNFTLLRNVIRA